MGEEDVREGGVRQETNAEAEKDTETYANWILIQGSSDWPTVLRSSQHIVE